MLKKFRLTTVGGGKYKGINIFFKEKEGILKENFKIKQLTKAQIIISLDRLTRFKPTEEKYLRVFKNIITSNLIYPKFKKNELELMDYEELTKLVGEIFKYSFNSLNIIDSSDFSVNNKLLEYEKSVFIFDKNVEKLLNNKIDYKAAIALIKKEKNIPLNLKWLIFLAENSDQIKNRANFAIKFPLEKIVLVEGITEEILLPKFARICGLDFDKAGINLISAGGKNQVVKLFYQFSDILKLPLFVLLDNDAKENFDEIKPKLRAKDKVYILKSGEFEDILPLNLIKRTINKHFKNYFSVALDDLRKNTSMTQTLIELFKAHGLEFKKAEFAGLVEKNILNVKDASQEIEIVIEKIVDKHN